MMSTYLIAESMTVEATGGPNVRCHAKSGEIFASWGPVQRIIRMGRWSWHKYNVLLGSMRVLGIQFPLRVHKVDRSGDCLYLVLHVGRRMVLRGHCKH